MDVSPRDNGHSPLRRKIEDALRAIGASTSLAVDRGLPIFEDATDLVLAHTSQSGREHFLIPDAADRWVRMREAAASEDIVLVMISGFRSFDRQLQLIRNKLERGESIAAILEVMAPPGCSEHHTGRACDIGTPECEPLSEPFEETGAFRWLKSNAADFGFRMSYPRGNPLGFLYEPWHWCYLGQGQA
jgi:D-alanyl-D-alanine carboxypeptidase